MRKCESKADWLITLLMWNFQILMEEIFEKCISILASMYFKCYVLGFGSSMYVHVREFSSSFLEGLLHKCWTPGRPATVLGEKQRDDVQEK